MQQAFLILLVAISFTVTGELLLKHGMNIVGFLSLQPQLFLAGLVRAFLNPFILGGFALVFVASLFWLAVLSRIPLSVAYPMLSLSYVLAVFAAALFLGEHITWLRVLGVLIICTGVALVGLSYGGSR